jgi:hypothetical protein
MSPCSSWCEQLIVAFKGRIGVILILLQSLWESQGLMGPWGPAIWFKWPRWNNRLAVRVKSHGRIGPSVFQKLMSTHPFWIQAHAPTMNKRDVVRMKAKTCPFGVCHVWELKTMWNWIWICACPNLQMHSYMLMQSTYFSFSFFGDIECMHDDLHN